MFESSDGFDGEEKLKSIRESVNWEIEDERRAFVWQFYRLICNWKAQLPNLREIYQNDEIDWVIAECVRELNYQKPGIPYEAKFQLIDFVARTGYKYKPELDERGEPLLNQTTAIHRAARNRCFSVFPVLFEIYDGHDANYMDVESGLTHFHVACMYGREDVVEKFLRLGDERGQPLQLDAMRDNEGKTPLYHAVSNGHDRIYEELLRRGADPNSADAQGRAALYNLCHVHVIERFLELCDKFDRRVRIDARDNEGNTPLHWAVHDNHKKEVAELLLRLGVDPTLVNAEGTTALHVVCARYNDDFYPSMLLEYVKEKWKSTYVNAEDDKSNTPLHLALDNNHRKVVEWLIRQGADPTTANIEGSTPLHVVCTRYNDDFYPSMLLEYVDEKSKPLFVNAQDNEGNTPLHLALDYNRTRLAEWLMRNGANRNSTNAKGETPLHVACKHYPARHLVSAFSRVNARDKEGNTPLHLALDNGLIDTIESLLRNGADPNLSNAEGRTPLHVACDRVVKDDSLIDLFFKVNDELNRTVRVDARDDKGNTALQLAVENVFPSAVDVLLNRGADLTEFVFPSATCLIDKFRARVSSIFYVWYESKLRLVVSALMCAERLEVAGYRLDRSAALTIMKLFAEYELFERSPSDDQQKLLCDDAVFVYKAKRIMTKPNLSVYDLVRLKPEEEDELLTYADYFDLPERLRVLCGYPYDISRCALHLWEKMSRGFFQRWTLDPFRELINYRLPLEFCEKILDRLANEDLFNICLAAAGQNA
ncbi:ankyrin-3-like [Trichogramma pretiosum]|uniref:ankyrin-3-like n=1 Tax=Trichogramma pretiosum TaxID=7493 RepID=UPI000C71C83B|nr:ankyrin-3-like [Trichogramma pretiosum]